MSTITFYATTPDAPDFDTQQAILAQLNSFFPNASISVTGSNITVSAAYNIFAKQGIPVKLLGNSGDRYVNFDSMVYARDEYSWRLLGKLGSIAVISQTYYFNANGQGGGGNNNPFYVLNDASDMDILLPKTSDTVLFVKNGLLYLENSTGTFALTLNPVLPPNPISDYTDSDTDDDEDYDMPIYLNNQNAPSQKFVCDTTPRNMVVTALVAFNASSSNAGPFKVEILNMTNEFMYLAWGNGTLLTLDEATSYVLAPLERRIFVVPIGFTSISAILGGTTAVGELRATAEALLA